MSRRVRLCLAVVVAIGVAGMFGGIVRAMRFDAPLVVTMTNDSAANQIRVYDPKTGALVQVLPTHGKGGVGGNARGIRQYGGELVAVVNNGSGTVALFRRTGAGFRFDRLITTTSAPVSIDFGNDHMYVAGASSIDSFIMRGSVVGWMDGSALLELAGGGSPALGSTAQVGVIDQRQLLVTLKTDPDPGTVDVVLLHHGAVDGAVDAVSAPAGTLTPFGFSIYPDGTALVTLAHSSQDGVFRRGSFVAVSAAGQGAPCWTTRIGKYVFTANTASRTISRVVGTGAHVFVDAPIAAAVPTGAPSDIDAASGVLGVIDHAAGQSHLSLFSYNQFGDLIQAGTPITLGVPNANGVAIVAATSPDRE